MGGVVVPVIGRDELRRNKLATGRLRDLADLADVEDLGLDLRLDLGAGDGEPPGDAV